MLILQVNYYEVQTISAYIGVHFDVFNYTFSHADGIILLYIVFSRLSALRVEFVSTKKNYVIAVVLQKPGGSSLTKMRHIT